MAKILVVDDERDLVELVNFILTKSGHEVIQAYNGRDGIQMAKENKPNVILLDIKMPNIDGFMIGKIFQRNITTKDYLTNYIDKVIKNE